MKLPSNRWFWTDRKEDVREALVLSRPVFDQLIKMLEQDIETKTKALTAEEHFAGGNWSEKTASIIGEIKALKHTINLIKLEVKPNG